MHYIFNIDFKYKIVVADRLFNLIFLESILNYFGNIENWPHCDKDKFAKELQLISVHARACYNNFFFSRTRYRENFDFTYSLYNYMFCEKCCFLFEESLINLYIMYDPCCNL